MRHTEPKENFYYLLPRMSIRNQLAAYLPSPIRNALRSAVHSIDFLRVQHPITAALGPQYRRSRVFIEIDLTWACNLRCYNCNRSCEQAPTAEHMGLIQIQNFVEETVRSGQKWKRIRLLGGEPTLHPHIYEILDYLVAWRNKSSPNTLLEISTNGYGKKVQNVLSNLPSDIVINNTNKTDKMHSFRSFNVAPTDLTEYNYADFTNACWVSQHSGIGLTPYGYYACPIAGSIDRIFGFDIGRKNLPDSTDNMYDQLRVFCKLCGIFKRLDIASVHEPILTKSWIRAYEQLNDKKPTLSRY